MDLMVEMFVLAMSDKLDLENIGRIQHRNLIATE
jgi:hypothetical protein